MIDFARIVGFEWDVRAFWETRDSAAYVEWATAERARFPNLKPSTLAISLRLPLTLLERIKVAANRRRPLSVADQNVAFREAGRVLTQVRLSGVPLEADSTWKSTVDGFGSYWGESDRHRDGWCERIGP